MEFKWSSPLFPDNFSHRKSLLPKEVDRHPLEKTVIVVTNRASANVSDRRTSTTTTSWGGFDPLSDPLAELKVDDSPTEVDDEIVYKWPTFKSKVLSKFKIDEKISIKSSFLAIAKSTNSSGVPTSASTSSVADQVKQRLQTIDEASNINTSGETVKLTSEEFSIKMNQMSQLLLESWNSDQRVKSLKVVIQVTKILSETPCLQFYPSQFMLIAGILDSFGSLVSSRITNKVTESNINCSTQDVAIETAKNWFYKVSSIREVIPRFFIEISILKIYKFVFSPNQIIGNLNRLSIAVNGISHPIVSMYARCYLVKAMVELSTTDPTCYPFHSIRKVILVNFKSIFSLSRQLDDASINLRQNHNALSPALDWIVNSFKAVKGDQSLLLAELSTFKESTCLRCVLLKSIIDHCSDSLIETSHDKILGYILNVESEYSVSELIISFGNRIVASSKSLSSCEQSVKRKVISNIWKKMSTLSLQDYLSCVSAWIEFVVLNLTQAESGIVLDDLVKRATSASSLENTSGDSKKIDCAILNIVKSVAKSTSNIQLITHSIVPLLNVIHKSESKIEACKLLIENVMGGDLEDKLTNGSSEEQQLVSDQETYKSLYSLCKLLSNSIDFMTIEDEKRTISGLIVSCLRLIVSSYSLRGNDAEDKLETQLELLMESRSDFSDLDLVIIYLVYACNSLAVQCMSQGKKSGNRPLIQSCLAYSYITIPSLSDPHIQLQLYLHSIEVSLLTASLSQTDSFLKSAITLLNTLPPSYETADGRNISFDNFFVDYCSNLLSSLILVPDHPDHDIIYLAKALHTVVASREIIDPGHKITLLLRFLCYVSWSRQSNFPSHILGVDSNDKLYAGDETFVTELNSFGSKVLNEILDCLADVQNEQKKKQLAKQVLDWISTYGDMDELSRLCQKLFKLCK